MRRNKDINNKKRSIIPSIIFIIVVMLGILIMLYPTLADQYNKWQQKKIINSYKNVVENMDENQSTEVIQKARLYNEQLYSSKSKEEGYYENKLYNAYDELLNFNTDGMMGYIQIPKINIEIPIYHGVDDEVLQKGVGHVKDTSLPVGGDNTHAVISGHRGLASSKLFTNLDQLKVDDIFFIHIANEVLAYKVNQIDVVEPSEIDYIKIQEGRDYVTLITCTPYGINTHRLLVRGTRIDYTEDLTKEINNNHNISLSVPDIVMIIGFIIVLFIIIFVIKSNKKARKKYHYKENVKNTNSSQNNIKRKKHVKVINRNKKGKHAK